MIVKDTRKDFCTYLSGKRKDVENVGPLLNGAEDLVTQVLNTFFTSSSTSKTNLHKTQALTTTGKAWSSVDNLDGRVPGWRICEQVGHIQVLRPWWDEFTSAKGSGRCRCGEQS